MKKEEFLFEFLVKFNEIEKEKKSGGEKILQKHLKRIIEYLEWVS